jgi:hypothetical protein
MAKTASRPAPNITHDLTPLRTDCPHCGQLMWADYANRRTIATLGGLTRLHLTIRRCRNRDCPAYHRLYRPEAEGRVALPRHQFGLDVSALVGALRYAERRSVPEIHRYLVGRGLASAERTVTNLLDRYHALSAVTLTDHRRPRGLRAPQGRVILALGGLQPDVGHEVLWVLRDCPSGAIRLARSLLPGRQHDLAALLREARDGLPVPIPGVVADGQHPSRSAVSEVLPDVPHHLCHFHYLCEAARPISEADRHAKEELTQRVRGAGPIERSLEGRDGPEAEAARGYCDAVRSALTDDGRPPLGASGLKRHERPSAITASLDRVAETRGSRTNSPACTSS